MRTHQTEKIGTVENVEAEITNVINKVSFSERKVRSVIAMITVFFHLMVFGSNPLLALPQNFQISNINSF